MPIADEDSVEDVKGTTLIANLPGHQMEIRVRNVVCNYSLPMHVDLRRIVLNSKNVIFDRSRNVAYKQKRDPHCYVKIFSSGSVYIVGCDSEDECKRAARGVARMIQRSMQKLDSTICLRNFRISNMMATCKLPFGVKIEELAKKYPRANYDPEITVGLVWKSEDPKASLRIHTTGSITIIGATSSNDIISVIEHIWPIVSEFKCMSREGKTAASQRKRPNPLPSNGSLYEAVAAKTRKTAPVYDPACSEFFEENMNLDDEELFYDENRC